MEFANEMIGILTEDSDRTPIKRLLTKAGFSVVVRTVPGTGIWDGARVLRHAGALLEAKPALTDLRVLADGDCQLEARRTEAANLTREFAKSNLPIKPAYFVVEHELESWLATSGEALAAVGINRRRRPRNADLHEPRRYLERLYKLSGKVYLQTRDNEILAQHVNVDSLCIVHRNFGEFIEGLKAVTPVDPDAKRPPFRGIGAR